MPKKYTLFIFVFLLPVILLAQTFGSGNINQPIPNNLQSLYLPIDVRGLPASIDKNFGLISVCIDISHTAAWDLDIVLVAPNGLRMELTSNNGGTGDNFRNTCFQMSATRSVIQGTAPFTGSYRPHGDFGAANNGQNPNGMWALSLIDDFPQSDQGTIHSWSITFGNNPPAPPVINSRLPIIKINTHGQYLQDEVKKQVTLSVINSGGENSSNDPPNGYHGPVAMELRGSSSIQYHKKSFGFNTITSSGLDQDYPLLGLPPEHKWILYAPYADKSMMRNTLTFRIFREMGHYAPRTRFVEVFLDGQYRGIYVLTEKIKRDRNRVDIADLNVQDITGDQLTGGYIIRVDRPAESQPDFWDSHYPSTLSGEKVRFQYEYPRPDKIVQQQKDYIREFMNDFEDVLQGPGFADPKSGYRKYINTGSFIDFLILNEVTKNVDGYRLSTFLYKDKDSRGGKLACGPPWDFNIAWGNSSFGEATDPTQWQWYGWDWVAIPNNEFYPIPFWWMRLMEDTAFQNELNCRYKELRAGPLSMEEFNKLIDADAAYIKEARIRNFYQWPILGLEIWPNPLPVAQTYEDELLQLKSWINDRLKWMDMNMPGKCNKKYSPAHEYTVYPNPFSNMVKGACTLSERGEVKLELYNTVGELVSVVSSGTVDPGRYVGEIDTSQLNNGFYVLRITNGNEIVEKKVIKLN